MSDLDELRYHAAQAARFARIGVILGAVSLGLAIGSLFFILVAL